MQISKIFCSLVFGFFLLTSNATQAAVTTNYTFGDLLTGYNGAPQYADFATMSATDNSNGIWNFTLTINNALFSTFGNDASIGSMSFDFNPDPLLPVPLVSPTEVTPPTLLPRKVVVNFL